MLQGFETKEFNFLRNLNKRVGFLKFSFSVSMGQGTVIESI